MTSSESLVPTGRPYGERQQIKADMQQAGLPLSPPAGGAPSRPGARRIAPTPGAPLAAGPALLDAATPDDFPFLADQPAAPELPADQPASVMGALGASAQSTFAQAVVARLIGRR